MDKDKMLDYFNDREATLFGMNWEAMHGIMSSCGKNWQRKTHTGKWWAKQHGSSIFSWMRSAMSWKAYDIRRCIWPVPLILKSCSVNPDG